MAAWLISIMTDMRALSAWCTPLLTPSDTSSARRPMSSSSGASGCSLFLDPRSSMRVSSRGTKAASSRRFLSGFSLRSIMTGTCDRVCPARSPARRFIPDPFRLPRLGVCNLSLAPCLPLPVRPTVASSFRAHLLSAPPFRQSVGSSPPDDDVFRDRLQSLLRSSRDKLACARHRLVASSARARLLARWASRRVSVLQHDRLSRCSGCGTRLSARTPLVVPAGTSGSSRSSLI